MHINLQERSALYGASWSEYMASRSGAYVRAALAPPTSGCSDAAPTTRRI